MSLSKYPPATTKLATIERFQCYMMLAYYPLEHLFYLRVHDIIPPFIWVPWSWKPTLLHPGKLVKWSCRFLAVYLLLQFAHLNEDRKLLLKKERALTKASGEEAETERVELKKKWAALKVATISTACKLPTSLHWYVLFSPYFAACSLFPGFGTIVLWWLPIRLSVGRFLGCVYSHMTPVLGGFI
jgi:hypothetical protein